MARIYRVIAVSLTALLMACSPHPEPIPAVQVKTVYVDKPVAVPCVEASAIPGEPAMVGDKLTGKAAHDADILGSSAIMLRQWGRELRALITPCVKP